MNHEFDCLRGQEFPELPADFRMPVEAHVLPLMKRRRVVRRMKVSLAVCAMVACFGYLYSAIPWDLIETTGRNDLVQIAKNLKHSTGIAYLGIEDKSLEELLELRRELEGQQGRTSASLAHIPIQNIVEWADYMVQGVVEEVTVDHDSLMEDLEDREVRPLYLTVRLRVVKSQPPLDKEYILVSSTGDLDRMRVGNGFLMALKSENGAFWPMYSFGAQGTYSIQGEGEDAIVSGLHDMSVESAWEFISDLHDTIHGREHHTDTKILESKIDTLKNGTLEEATLALQYLSVADMALLNADLLLEALENQYDQMLEDDEVSEGTWTSAGDRISHRVVAYHRFAQRALKILYQIAQEDAVDRLLELYIHDMSNVYKCVFDQTEFAREFFRFAVKHLGPDRRDRVLSLLGKEVVFYDEKENRIGGVILARADYRNLEILAKTPGDDIDVILMDVFHNPDAYNPWGGNALGQTPEELQNMEKAIIEMRKKILDFKEPMNTLEMLEASIAERNGKTEYFPNYIMHRIRPGDKSFVTIMQRFPIEHVADVIWLKVPDPVFVQALRDAIGKNTQNRSCAPLLQALHACGEEVEAIRLATQLLESPIDDSSLDNLESETAERIETLLYLGRVGNTVDTDVVPLISSFLRPELLVKYDESQRRAYEITLRSTEPDRRQFLAYRSLQRHPLSVEVKTAALLALTRMREPGIVKEWQDIYRKDDIPQRMTASIALYYLGDDTSNEYIQVFRNHAERSIAELDRHLHRQGWTGDFQRTAMYLRSPETDTLFLDRLDKGLDPSDRDPLVYDVAFVMDHTGRILRTLLAHHESKDMMTRSVAHSCLESILDSDSEWEGNALAGAQPEVVQQLRTEVEAFITENMIPDQ